MRARSFLNVVLAVALAAASVDAGAKSQGGLTDFEIRKILIRDSIASYPGNCPCPYSTARNGSRCGGRSAWSRPGGESPYCYPKDVPDSAVQVYRDEHKSD